MSLQSLQRDVENVINNLNDMVLESAMENESTIVDFNTSQLSEGLRTDNKPIEPSYYSPLYAKMKKQMGSKASEGTPNLFLEGDFYGGFYAQKTKDWIEVHSTDWKEKKLTLKYDMIMGLTNEHLGQLAQYSKYFLLKKIKNGLHIS